MNNILLLNTPLQLSALIYICKFTHHNIVQYVVDCMVFRWGYSHLRTFEFTFRAKMREWEVVKVKKQKGEDTRARAKLRREVAFLLSFLRLRTFSSPSQLLLLAVATSAFAFLCMCTCSTLSFKHNVDCKSGICGRGRTLRKFFQQKLSYDEIQILLC